MINSRGCIASKTLGFVDASRLAVAGCRDWAVQALLGQKASDYKAAIAISTASDTWDANARSSSACCKLYRRSAYPFFWSIPIKIQAPRPASHSHTNS